jgi:LacI family transcriptional regulator, galactose operon repressor
MAKRKGKVKGASSGTGGTKAVTLKDVAESLQLSPSTVSLVLNRSPVAESIPEETQNRVFAAARELNYRPNYLARSLRRQRSHSVGVLVPELSEGYAAGILSGIEDHLVLHGYFQLVTSHRDKAHLVGEYLDMLQDRSVEGFILVATPIDASPVLPTAAIAGHRKLDGVTNVVIDHDFAAKLALAHLTELGHERIAFFKGQATNADTEDRWRANLEVADAFGLEVHPDLTLQLSDAAGPQVFPKEQGYEEGYAFGQLLLDRGVDFTALFAFNDTSAIGAMRAFLDAGLRVPEDVSVVGFDDIQSAAFQNPSLTTVRQPLAQMGEIAARSLLQRIASGDSKPESLTVQPQLVVRDSTGPPSTGAAAVLASGQRRAAK